MCADNLKRRKGRTFLTVLGVFIGCCSIIVMVSIGIGMTEMQDQMISNMGDLTIVEVYQGTSTEGQPAKLNDDAVDSFSELAGVQAVYPKYENYEYTFNIFAGLNNRYSAQYATIIGVNTDAMEDMGIELLEGEAAGKGKDEGVCGQYFEYSFKDTLMPDGSNTIEYWSYMYDDNGKEIENPDLPDPYFDAMTTPVTIRATTSDMNQTTYEREIQITGRTKQDTGKGYETSQGLMISVDTFKDIVSKITGVPVGKTEYTSISVKATDIDSVADVEAAIKSMGYSTSSMASIREEMQKSARQTQMMLGGLGAISLFVAAIGITNTMIMSISERTKEIGIMKSLGCYVRDIRAMFLMEAGAIGLIGGIFGSIISLMASWIINIVSFGQGFTEETLKMAMLGGEGVTRVSVVPLWLILFAICFSIMIGLVSGYYPANKAVKIPALEAIKSE